MKNFRNLKKLFLCLLSVLLIVSGTGFDSCAETVTEEESEASLSWPGLGKDIKAESAIVMDADTHQILWGKDIHAKRYPASVTKILTGLIVIDRCALDEEVTFSSSAVENLESGAVTIGAVAGDTMDVKNCLYALLLKSANEVANALAEHVSGSVTDFAGLMNLYAAELGCVDSDFKNPSGLTDPEHVTSAYDMALIACACMNNETFLELESEPTRKLSGTEKYPDGLTVTIGHKMLREGESYYDSRVVAGKTGFTTASGNTLVTMAEDHGRRVVVVVLKDSNPAHYEDTKALLDYGLDEFTLLSPTEEILEEMFSVTDALLEIGAVEKEDPEAGCWNKITVTSSPLIAVPAGCGLGDTECKIEKVPSSEDSPLAVATITLKCLDSFGKSAVITNERTEPETEAEQETVTQEKKKKKAEEENTSSGLGVLGWVVFAALLTAVLAAAFLYYRQWQEKKRRAEKRRKRMERLGRIGEKTEEHRERMNHARRQSKVNAEKAEEPVLTEEAEGTEAPSGKEPDDGTDI